MNKIFKTIKRVVRSRDIRFGLQLGPEGTERTLVWRSHRIFYRALTTDPGHIERLLLLGKRCEYNLPTNIDPKCILDAGSNIGLAALYFSELFPMARIVCCEPSAENVELARRNTAQLPNVSVIQCALGRNIGVGKVQPALLPNNYSGLTVTETPLGNVPIYDYPRLLQVAGVPFFDLIKIDIEGSEYPFLTSLDDAAFARCKWIVGEVHGANEWLLLDMLSKHFAIDIRKTMLHKYSKFHACNLSETERLLGGFDVSILQK
ncbi:MAG: FkbM family methyltransferase [Chthoniobacterales bacterium]